MLLYLFLMIKPLCPPYEYQLENMGLNPIEIQVILTILKVIALIAPLLIALCLYWEIIIHQITGSIKRVFKKL